jgi:hypothetical protein
MVVPTVVPTVPGCGISQVARSAQILAILDEVSILF